jgi:hypothetical protein
MGGFLGTGVPIYEIADAYRADDIQDMLVRNTHLGAALAACFSDSGSDEHLTKHAVTLMRGHGFTVVAENIEECVLRAVYTQKNAMIQTAALTTCNSWGGSAKNIRYLSEKESAAATNMTKWSALRPWKLWLREVEACGLYVNSA